MELNAAFLHYVVTVLFCSEYMGGYESNSDGGDDVNDDDITDHMSSGVQKP